MKFRARLREREKRHEEDRVFSMGEAVEAGESWMSSVGIHTAHDSSIT